jgi:hypothetical protein
MGAGDGRIAGASVTPSGTNAALPRDNPEKLLNPGFPQSSSVFHHFIFFEYFNAKFRI